MIIVKSIVYKINILLLSVIYVISSAIEIN